MQFSYFFLMSEFEFVRLPDLSVLREGRHGGALLCVVLRQRRADLQHIWLSGLRDHHGVVERSRH